MQQLDPILKALASCEKTAASCDTLQAALPHCLASSKQERHGFQVKIVEATVSALKDLEEASRTSLAEAEAAAAKLQAQSDESKVNYDSAQLVANAKKDESDAKGQECENFGKEVDAAKGEVKAQIEKKDAFLAGMATLSVEQEAFQKVLEELWQPLKSASFLSQQWRKRDKCCNELVEKIKPLGLEDSLVEALKATLKLKVEQRSAFAQRALTCVEEALEKHSASFSERVAGAGAEEAARTAGVTEAEKKLAISQEKMNELDNQHMELQNVWAELETKAGEAKNSVTSTAAELEEAIEEVAECKAAVDAALAHSAAFAVLCEPPAPAALPEQEEAVQPPASSMEIEPEAVAVAA
jgi:chromosome segregation ATPase